MDFKGHEWVQEPLDAMSAGLLAKCIIEYGLAGLQLKDLSNTGQTGVVAIRMEGIHTHVQAVLGVNRTDVGLYPKRFQLTDESALRVIAAIKEKALRIAEPANDNHEYMEPFLRRSRAPERLTTLQLFERSLRNIFVNNREQRSDLGELQYKNVNEALWAAVFKFGKAAGMTERDFLGYHGSRGVYTGFCGQAVATTITHVLRDLKKDNYLDTLKKTDKSGVGVWSIFYDKSISTVFVMNNARGQDFMT